MLLCDTYLSSAEIRRIKKSNLTIMRFIFTVLLLGIALFPISGWAGYWWPLDNDANENTGYNASIRYSGSAITMAWEDLNYNLYLADRWQINGTTVWSKMGGCANPNHGIGTSNPSLVILSNGLTFVAFAQDGQIYVKEAFNDWIPVGGSVNCTSTTNAGFPCLRIFENNYNNYYLASHEQLGARYQICVKKIDNGDWVQVGSHLHIDQNKDAVYPSLIIDNAEPYIAWSETNGTQGEVYAAHYNGTSWQMLGGTLNAVNGSLAENANLVLEDGTPYIAWDEKTSSSWQIHVAHFNGVNWVAEGDSPSSPNAVRACQPKLTFNAGVPYVAWKEGNGSVDQVHVAHLSGSTWVEDGPTISQNDQHIGKLDLQMNASVPYVSFDSPDSNGVSRIHQYYYSLSLTPTPLPTATVTATPRPTSSPWGEWQQIGEKIANTDIQGMNLAVSQQVPYIAYTTSIFQNYNGYNIIVLHHTNNGWEQLGPAVHSVTTAASSSPRILINQGTPYVVWREEEYVHDYDQTIFVKHYNGQSWELVGNAFSISRSDCTPEMVIQNGDIQVAFDEIGPGVGPLLYIETYRNGTWTRSTSYINVSRSELLHSTTGASMVEQNGISYIAWTEDDTSRWDNLRVKKTTQNGWDIIDGTYSGISGSNFVSSPSIDVYKSQAYVTWCEYHGYSGDATPLVHVKCSTGHGWVDVGYVVNDDQHGLGFGPYIRMIYQVPYVLWCQNQNIKISYFKNNVWNTINPPPTNGQVNFYSVTSEEVNLYAAWYDNVQHQITVSQLACQVPTQDEILLEKMPQVSKYSSATFPNPGSHRVTFVWDESNAEKVWINIYNTVGERIATLSDAPNGNHLTWTTGNTASGIYYYQITLSVGGVKKVLPIRKLAILK